MLCHSHHFIVQNSLDPTVPSRTRKLRKSVRDEHPGMLYASPVVEFASVLLKIYFSNVCVEDVYNCAWCSDGSGSRCVVGTMESTAKCKGVCYDPEACGESLTRIWMYMFFAATLLLMVLGFFVMKMLPVAKAFRILSLVVATIGGSFFGMFVSFIVSVSLVEISETPIFAISYGIFFFLEAVIVTRFIRTQLKDRSVCTVHSITLCKFLWIHLR